MYRLVKDESEEMKSRFPGGCCFKFLEDDKHIGIAVINSDEDDKIYIYIKKELRGNGYGKLLFSEVINELVKNGYKDIKVKFNKENIQMLKIVKDNEGFHISTDGEIVRYIIPVR